MDTAYCLHLHSRSLDATLALGKALGALLIPGDVVALNGDLGAGKTALTTGIAAGLGCAGTVASPTFVLERIHPAGTRGLILHHFDLYRLQSSDDVMDLGFDETIHGQDVCVIEWASIADEILPENRIRVRLRHIGNDDRKIDICFSGTDAVTRSSTLHTAFPVRPDLIVDKESVL